MSKALTHIVRAKKSLAGSQAETSHVERDEEDSVESSGQYL